MGSKIKKIGICFPEEILTNDQLAEVSGRWDPQKIEQKLGIKERRISQNNETASDLAYRAALQVLDGYDKEKIDMLILCTQSPDYFLPTTACLLQDRLNLSTKTGAYDFNLGCSGFIYGLAMAKSFVLSGIASHILLVTSETYSKYINAEDIALRTVFGDGAAATLIEKSDTEHIHDFALGTDGSGMNNLIVKNGASRNRYDTNPIKKETRSGDIYTDNDLYMNGPEIFNFTINTVPKAILSCLEKNSMNLEDVDYFIFHQANAYIIEYLRKKMNICKDKFHKSMLFSGNTVSSTIPIAYMEALNNGQIIPGNKVLLCGFGVGYSWGAVIVEV